VRWIVRLRAIQVSVSARYAGSRAVSVGAAGELEPVAVYANVADFAAEYLLPLYRRKAPTWCSQWWKHPEAVVRLQALWLS
jgi:hypothetical protein